MLPWNKIFHPSLLARQWIRKQPDWSLQTKLDLDWFPLPHYAYGLSQAVRQARGLGIDRLTAVQVGVGNGDASAALEAIAAELEQAHPVKIDLVAIDVASPTARSTDPRDEPYLTEPAPLDPSAVEAKLKRTSLRVGEVQASAGGVLALAQAVPIGFVGFDANYSMTSAGLDLLRGPSASRLPRPFACFERLIGDDAALRGPHAGQLLALAEFNAQDAGRQLHPIHGLRHKRVFQAAWCEQVYVLHDLAHPRYVEPISMAENAAEPAPS